MINPKEFTQRAAINSLTGIKSSLGNLRKVVSLTYLLYLANKKKSSIVYAESKDGKIVLKQEYKSFIQHYLNNSEVIEKIDDNPLLTSQIESLYVGLTLMFAFGRISFENTSLSMTKERTGGIRYPKKIDFASNIMTLDLMLNSDSEEAVKATLLAWLQDKQLDNKIEQRISIFLNICIENNLFKLRHGENDLYFQTEGIYKSLITGNEVSLESDEIVGPTRILNSMLRENLVPWLNFKKSLVTINADNDFNVKEYSDIISTSLSIRDIKVDNNVESAPKEEDTDNDDKQLPLQQITYGAPGTGKSHGIKKETAGKSVIRTTFHPDSDYSTFVGAYKPTSVEVPVMTIIGKEQIPVVNANPEKKIVYEFVPQAFLKAYTGAWKNQDEPFFLIIEEINRGNCAQIFGDLFQLLDRNDETGLSDYPISPDEDIQKFLLTDKKYGFAALTDAQKAAIPIEVQSGELMILPKNLHIWATMNTSDQSLFPIDSAFKRRWDWQYMPISDGKKGWQIAVNGKCYDWWQFLQKMNDKIGSTTNSEDKKLGYFFCKAKNGIIDAETFVGKVVFYIWNDVFKDFAEEAGDLFKDIEGILTFNKFYTIGVDRKAKVVEEKVERLLQNLGVDEIGEYDNVGEKVIDDTESASRRVLNVEFEDETIAIKRFPQYLQVLQKIGLDKAEAVASEKQVDVLGCALVSKNKEETIEESQYSYVEVDGYFVVKGIKGKVMMNFLPLISDKYSLNLKIAYK
ncbi:5-methylcytosine-specific restriction endonuclease subunit McrB [Prevotella pectinovora]|uniref:hypothetical protein n=1 Tax=Prevotella pectinovora TaxID=1602169 RepID=UPI000698F519|nr:hypothetical protein [Prevotella pectinovora]